MAAKASVLRRALPRTKKGILDSSAVASSVQTMAVVGGRFSQAGLCGLLRRLGVASAQVRRTGGVVELEVVAEHGEQVLLQAHDQGCTQVSKITLAPSNPIWGEWRAGKSCTCTGGRDHRARDAQALAI